MKTTLPNKVYLYLVLIIIFGALYLSSVPQLPPFVPSKASGGFTAQRTGLVRILRVFCPEPIYKWSYIYIYIYI